MRSWRRVGALAFAVFAVLEMGDFAGLVPRLFSPVSSADLTGLRVEAQMVRLGILAVLAAGIVIAGGVTALGLFRYAGWTQHAAWLTAGLFACYGLYQIVSALTELTKRQTGVAIAGAVYVLLGLAALWLERKASRAD